MTFIRSGHLIDTIDRVELPVYRDPCPNRMLRRGLRHFAIVDAKYQDQLEVMRWRILKNGKVCEKGYPMSHRNKSRVIHSFALVESPFPCPTDPTKLHVELLEMLDPLEILELVQAVKDLPSKRYLLPLLQDARKKPI